MISNLRRTLSEALRWLWQQAERFPIPVEDALWVQTYRDSQSTDRLSIRTWHAG